MGRLHEFDVTYEATGSIIEGGRPRHDVAKLGRLSWDSMLTWNSRRISADTMTRYLRLLSDEETPPFILLVHDNGADCGEFKRIRQLISENYRCERGSCGQISGNYDVKELRR